MLTPDFYVRSLVRVASIEGREALEKLITGQFSITSQEHGQILVSGNLNGKMFTYETPDSTTPDRLMAAAEQALGIFDTLTEEQLTAFLKGTQPRSRQAIFS